MNKAFLLLGSNLGERELFLSKAIELFEKSYGKVVAISAIYSTAPWPAQTEDKNKQNDFLNQAVCIETRLSAPDLLNSLLKIEKEIGRIRNKKWEARIIDIDILFYNEEIINTALLTVPHPYLHLRKFALVPLAEIAAEFIHPVFKKSIKNILSENSDNLPVNRYFSEPSLLVKKHT